MSRKYTPQKTALVTGGAKRIGRAICLALSSLGYTIALQYHRSSGQAKSTASAIRRLQGHCDLFSRDLSDETQTAALIDDVQRKCPGLVLLINNAAIFEQSDLRQAESVHSLHKHFRTNFSAPYILMHEFARKCSNGHIINLLDAHIARNKTDHLGYLLSKKALADLTKLSAVALAPAIRVNAIAPGFILLPEDKGNAYIKHRAKNIPLERKGELGDISKSVKFLLDNTYVTGQIIFVDGGEHLVS